jgi:hypothetical protein
MIIIIYNNRIVQKGASIMRLDQKIRSATLTFRSNAR